jgi:hypothetical protein
MFQETSFAIVELLLILIVIHKKSRRTDMSRSSRFLEYMKLHLISLEQDLEMNPESINVIDIPGQIEATRHLLSVATDIMNSYNEGEIA